MKTNGGAGNLAAWLLLGTGLMIGLVAASVMSSAILNPAVALGTRQWVWGTYVLGPVLGAVIGFNLYALLFAPGESLLDRAKSAVKAPVKAVAKKKK